MNISVSYFWLYDDSGLGTGCNQFPVSSFAELKSSLSEYLSAEAILVNMIDICLNDTILIHAQEVGPDRLMEFSINLCEAHSNYQLFACTQTLSDFISNLDQTNILDYVEP